METKAAAPAVAGMEKLGGVMGQYYRVSFAGEPAAYLNAIPEITLNGTPVKAVTNLFGETKSYKLSNDPAFGGVYRFVDVTEDCFKGEAKVVITAEDYQDLSFTVVDGVLAK